MTGVFVIAVHHTIVLAGEEHMQKVFGQEYLGYCNRATTVFLTGRGRYPQELAIMQMPGVNGVWLPGNYSVREDRTERNSITS
jgi:hypothetical protein